MNHISGKKFSIRKTSLGSILCIVSLMTAGIRSAIAESVWAEPDLVAAVMTGEKSEASVSWWGFESGDSTKYLQAAIDSGVARVVVPFIGEGEDWVVSPIHMTRDDQQILFEEGVVVRAKKGSIRNRGTRLFDARNRNNIVFSGYGATLEMSIEEYYRSGHRVGGDLIFITGCENVLVEGLNLRQAWNDGIYIGSFQSDRDYSKNIVIRDVVIDDCRRQGISVISVENLLIENTVLKNTAGAPPMAGIDFEPNHARERLVNVVLRNVITQNNSMAGLYLYLSNLDGDSEPVSMRFENCISKNDHIGILLRRMGGDSPPRGRVEFINTRVENPLSRSVQIEDKCPNSSLVRFENCVFTGSRTTPLVFSDRGQDWGGVEFIDTVVEDWLERPFVQVGKATNLSGMIQVRSPYTDTIREDEELRDLLTEAGLRVRFTKADIVRPPVLVRAEVPLLAELVPAGPSGLEQEVTTVAVRNSQAYALYADRGEAVELAIQARLGRHYEVEISSPSGRLMEHYTSSSSGDRKVEFTAPESGVYLIAIASPPWGNIMMLRTRNRLSLLTSAFAQRDTGRRPTIQGEGSIYFWVPEGISEFVVNVRGIGDPANGIRIFDSQNRLVVERDNIPTRPGTNFIIQPEPGETGRIWRIEKGDSRRVGLKLFDPIPPVVSYHPEALLVPSSNFVKGP